MRVIATPGHTLGHITYWLPGESVAFVGDTLFAMGCGRLLEGDADNHVGARSRSSPHCPTRPGSTAATNTPRPTPASPSRSIPDNADLAARYDEVKALRAAGKPTLPTTIGLEKKTNPFLRAGDPTIRALLGMSDAPRRPPSSPKSASARTHFR